MASTDYTALTELSERLIEAADAITNSAAALIQRDIMAAARVCSAHATLRLAVSEISPNCDPAAQEELYAALAASDRLIG
jgi:hypothetical protein